MTNLIFPGAVHTERDFYDRERETERIKNDFLNGEQRLVIIIGERRIGKTSIMLVSNERLAANATNRFVPFFFSERWYIHSFKDFAKEILQRFCKYLGKQLSETGLLDARGDFQEPSSQQLIDALAVLLKDVANQIFIIGIDEFDMFITQGNFSTGEALKILGWIHQVIDDRALPIVFLLSMSGEPDLLRLAEATPLTALGDIVSLTPFPKEEVIKMVSGILKDQMELTKEALERFYMLTAGHPFFIKLLLFHLLERYLLEEGAAVQVTQDMLDDELMRAAINDHRAAAAFRNVYEVHMGPFEQKLLLLLARYGQGIPRTGLRSLGAEYETAAKELVNRGYLVERPRGAYCYQIELLRLWVRQWERYDLEYQRLDVEMLKRILEVEVIVDLAKREVHIRGEVRPLSPQEYYLLELLCQRHDQLVTRKDLVSRLDSLYPGQTSSIDIVIHRLREKLGDRLIEDDAKKRHYLYIQNAPSQGYMISTERLMMRNGISDPLGDKK